ncbi:MAG: SRPBCC family protein [Angustibacter sp.]
MAEQTRSSIEVAATPAAVLAVIADFPAYSTWAAAVRSAEVLSTDADGRALSVRFALDAGAIKDTYTLNYSWQVTPAGTGTVSWILADSTSVLTALDGSYTLEAAPSGPTTVAYQLTVDLRVPMLGLLKRKAEKSIVNTALKELKKQAEG